MCLVPHHKLPIIMLTPPNTSPIPHISTLTCSYVSPCEINRNGLLAHLVASRCWRTSTSFHQFACRFRPHNPAVSFFSSLLPSPFTSASLPVTSTWLANNSPALRELNHQICMSHRTVTIPTSTLNDLNSSSDTCLARLQLHKLQPKPRKPNHHTDDRLPNQLQFAISNPPT